MAAEVTAELEHSLKPLADSESDSAVLVLDSSDVKNLLQAGIGTGVESNARRFLARVHDHIHKNVPGTSVQDRGARGLTGRGGGSVTLAL